MNNLYYLVLEKDVLFLVFVLEKDVLFLVFVLEKDFPPTQFPDTLSVKATFGFSHFLQTCIRSLAYLSTFFSLLIVLLLFSATRHGHQFAPPPTTPSQPPAPLHPLLPPDGAADFLLQPPRPPSPARQQQVPHRVHLRHVQQWGGRAQQWGGYGGHGDRCWGLLGDVWGGQFR